ncbi:MAG: 30S ribosomal protein S9 [Candidatus Gastranaerophilales bacterium]|nr:30S ribosomal protein S9 [Candidatus Gastranaerophilales bacterium]
MAEKEYRAVGRRKTAIAIARLSKGKGRVFINNKTLKAYLGERLTLETMIFQPLALTGNETKFDIRVKAIGGGVSAQAGAIRHAISKALLEVSPEYKQVLKTEGLLTRDSRIKERKKYGRKKARKRFQFSKR